MYTLAASADNYSPKVFDNWDAYCEAMRLRDNNIKEVRYVNDWIGKIEKQHLPASHPIFKFGVYISAIKERNRLQRICEEIKDKSSFAAGLITGSNENVGDQIKKMQVKISEKMKEISAFEATYYF